MTTGFLAGSFDLLTVADIDLVRQARQQCDHLIVGVQSDALVDKLHGRPPVTPLDDRRALISHVRGVDEVFVQHRRGDVPDGIDIVLHHQGAAMAGQADESSTRTLMPRRQTESQVLRDALAPLSSQVVA